MPFETRGATADPFGDWQCQDDATVAVLTILVAIIVGFSADHGEALVDKESCRVTLDRECGASAMALAPHVAATVIRCSRER